jgi:MFS family permease
MRRRSRGLSWWLTPVPTWFGYGAAAGGRTLPKTSGTRKLVWEALRHAEFRWYFTGNLISNLGTWMQNTAQVLLAYRLTHSVFEIGLLACAQFLCPLLLGSWAGVLTERIGTRSTLIGCQILSAMVAAALAVAESGDWLTERELIAGALVTGLFFTFTAPAQSVMAPVLAPDVGTQAPIAMNSVSYNAGRTVAPALSVLVVMTVGFSWAFAFNALSFCVYAVMLQRCTDHSHSGQSALRRSRFLDGFRTARREPRITVLLLMVAAVTVADDPVLVLGPALARHIFGTSADWSGYFLSALGAGSVLGSLLPGWRAQSGRHVARALGLLGVSMMAFAIAPCIYVSLIAAFAAGTTCLVAGSAAQALLHDLGRQRAGTGAADVMGLWLVAWAGSKPIASFADGMLAAHIGIRPTGLILATPAVIPALILLLCPDRLLERVLPPRPSSPSSPPSQDVREKGPDVPPRPYAPQQELTGSVQPLPIEMGFTPWWAGGFQKDPGPVVRHADCGQYPREAGPLYMVLVTAGNDQRLAPHRKRRICVSAAGSAQVISEDEWPPHLLRRDKSGPSVPHDLWRRLLVALLEQENSPDGRHARDRQGRQPGLCDPAPCAGAAEPVRSDLASDAIVFLPRCPVTDGWPATEMAAHAGR